MKQLFASLALMCAGLLNGPAQADPVVVELYTSQGCSSCPPADKLLHQLAERDDVIALALHVDYWDYIGWKDQFAHPAFTQRQRNYARAAGAQSVYTPQMIVGGHIDVIGNRPMKVAEAVERAKTADVIDLTLSKSGRTLQIQATRLGRVPAGSIVHLVQFDPKQSVSITRGENAGRTISYANVVKRWEVLGTWNGTSQLALSARLQNRPGVVLIQAPNYGPMLASARIP